MSERWRVEMGVCLMDLDANEIRPGLRVWGMRLQKCLRKNKHRINGRERLNGASNRESRVRGSEWSRELSQDNGKRMSQEEDGRGGPEKPTAGSREVGASRSRHLLTQCSTRMARRGDGNGRLGNLDDGSRSLGPGCMQWCLPGVATTRKRQAGHRSCQGPRGSMQSINTQLSLTSFRDRSWAFC
jgi:hypothetical protein